MSELAFISEVVYDLKMDYGVPVTLRRETPITNYTTGAVTIQVVEKPVALAIALPREKRHSFLRSIGNDKTGYLQPEDQEFIIDKLDLDQSLLPFDRIVMNGKSLKISRFEDYIHAYYILANNG